MAEGISSVEVSRPPTTKDIKSPGQSDLKKTAEKLPVETPPVTETHSKRRRLLKGLAAAAALAGVAVWCSKEIKSGKEGIETQNATFIPLYESHDKGLAAKDIPADLDIFFKEGMPKGYDINSPPFAYIRTVSHMPAVAGREPIAIKEFQESVLEKMAQNDIRFANPDIDPGVTIDEARRLVTIRSAAELAAAAVPWTYATAKDVIDELYGKEPTQKEISRRKFLKIAGVASAGMAASYIASNLAVNDVPLEETPAVQRIISRIQGFQSNFHPEDLIVFFRNVFAAEKMLTIAEMLKSEKNQKMKIGFNYGGAHSGIEDLLRAGPELCRVIISHYPKEYLQHVIEANSSLENLSSVMVVNLPKDFKMGDLDDRDKATKIQGSRIMDAKLYEQLQAVMKPTKQTS